MWQIVTRIRHVKVRKFSDMRHFLIGISEIEISSIGEGQSEVCVRLTFKPGRSPWPGK